MYSCGRKSKIEKCNQLYESTKQNTRIHGEDYHLSHVPENVMFTKLRNVMRKHAYKINQCARGLEVLCEIFDERDEELLQVSGEQQFDGGGDVRSNLCAHADPIRMLDEFETRTQPSKCKTSTRNNRILIGTYIQGRSQTLGTGGGGGKLGQIN